MPSPVPIECRGNVCKQGGFTALYGALLMLSLHWAVVLYINSSFLEQFVSPHTISILYIVGAVCTILAFLYASPLLSRYGNVKLTVILTVLEFVTLIGMAFTTSAPLAVVLFTIHQAVVPLLLFSLDLFMEELIGSKEESTGGRRGFLLGFMSLTTAVAAIGMGKIVGNGIPHFDAAYITSALMLIPFLLIIIARFRNFVDPVYPSLQIFAGIQQFWQQRDVRNVFFAHFLLQLFFTWMVIYTPLYFSTRIGFSWDQIGIILASGMMAYVFFEYPIGIIADKYIGEKEMMAFGFAVMAIATSWFVFLDNSSILVWMFAMFMTRVGASFVETTTESYFFKHTEGKDTNLIGLFRITRPLSYVLGAVLGSITLHLLPFELLFVVLGLFMVPGLFFAMALHDTK